VARLRVVLAGVLYSLFLVFLELVGETFSFRNDDVPSILFSLLGFLFPFGETGRLLLSPGSILYDSRACSSEFEWTRSPLIAPVAFETGCVPSPPSTLSFALARASVNDAVPFFYRRWAVFSSLSWVPPAVSRPRWCSAFSPPPVVLQNEFVRFVWKSASPWVKFEEFSRRRPSPFFFPSLYSSPP